MAESLPDFSGVYFRVCGRGQQAASGAVVGCHEEAIGHGREEGQSARGLSNRGAGSGSGERSPPGSCGIHNSSKKVPENAEAASLWLFGDPQIRFDF